MHSPKTILIIDDDENIRDLLQEFLQNNGYKVILADDGLQGMEMIRQENVSLVILDVKLPYISGLGLTEIASQAKPELPIICITGHANAAKQVPLEQVCLIIHKPFKLQEMLEAVRENLG